MAKTQEPGRLDPDPDPLAAVVLHTLVSRSAAMTLAQVVLACERDPEQPEQTREVQRALAILLDDGLAERAGDRYRPTRPAIRAAELSF